MTTLAELFDALKYRVVIANDGTRRYYNDAGRLHRTDGPAIVYPYGGQEWYRNGLRHRTDDPAIEWGCGACEWWIDGVQYTQQEYYLQLKALGFNT